MGCHAVTDALLYEHRGRELRQSRQQMTATRHPAITKALNLALAQTNCTKDQAISMVVATLAEAGIPLKTALDAVVGPGTYQLIADTTWELLQPVA